MGMIRGLIVALAMFSRVPVPRVDWTEENRRWAMCFFPCVGLVVAAALALWLWLCGRLGLGAALKGAVGALIPLAVTGGIHMDGFMDTVDALASCQPREKKLEILKDSRVGAFAAMACAGYLLATAGLMSELAPGDAPRVGACFVLSRALSAWAMTAFQSARPDGMLNGFARASQPRAVAAASAIWAAASLAALAITGGWLAAAVAGVAAICLLGYRRMAYRQFGGVTGDLAGWFLQVTELCCVAAVAMGGKLL